MDIIVVGAGLAGLVAARDLRADGHHVRVLEARDRPGGRTWSTVFPATGARVELGAEWFSPSVHTAVAAELARYGLSAARPGSSDGTWVSNGVAVADSALAPGEGAASAALCNRIDADAKRIDFANPAWHVGLDDLDVPFAAYLDRIGAHGRVRDFILAVSFELAGADEHEYTALQLLHEFAGYGSFAHAESDESLRVPSGQLAAAVAADLGDIVQFNHVVTGVRHAAPGCEVVLDDDSTWQAQAVIMAVPVNCLDAVDLPESVPVVGRHAGRAAKVWTQIDGHDAALTTRGWPGLVETYVVPGPTSSALASFQLRTGTADEQLALLRTQLGERFPDARLGQHHWHDWSGDNFARGTWCTARPAQLDRLYDLSQHPGPVLFAGGDISRQWIGWMDGAITSGTDAARRAQAYLSTGITPAATG
ncbi:flavin monoamine oxidase family protein [Fodinicola acaciae]|uniref:flavin monoamine oxidase family protein n=1 Tax=Fodinicola acaciae TaxID=2681555 RepID=UPI0013D182FB|nr:NAD(P)/FAD-dependent oxidoreductase [Fodinicola acaciae]